MPLTVVVAPEPSSRSELVVRLLRAGGPPDDLPEGAVRDAAREPVLLYEGGKRLLLVTVNEDGDGLEELRVAAARAADVALRLEVREVSLVVDRADGAEAGALVEGFVLGGYRFGSYRQEEQHTVDRLVLAGGGVDGHGAEAQAALLRAEGACFARDLVNRSPHEKSAPLLAELAREMADEVGLRCEVWDAGQIESERMGGLMAVNRGSVDPPRFVVLEHAPPGTAEGPPVVLVGKAIVFDTGGLSLKPTKNSMDKMKADMAGGAAVMAVMRTLARAGTARRVVALIPMTDNRPGGNAYVPGDVVRMRSGLSVEVLNTDAEGRMILADALHYAGEFEPSLVVDVATLTGSAVVALGERVAAVFSSEGGGSEDRLRLFVEAGRRTGEFVHPLPMNAFYSDALKTDVADLKNVGGREGGAITAAKFLERFTRNDDGEPAYPWIHVDVAGPSFIDSPQPYRPKGGTGFGVRLLLEVLENLE